MVEHGLPDLRLIIPVAMTFMGHLAFPGISANLWQGLRGHLTSRRTKNSCRSRKAREERLKKYREIDIRNLK